MIKAEINKAHIKAEISGDFATILDEIHGFLADMMNFSGKCRTVFLWLSWKHCLIY